MWASKLCCNNVPNMLHVGRSQLNFEFSTLRRETQSPGMRPLSLPWHFIAQTEKPLFPNFERKIDLQQRVVLGEATKPMHASYPVSTVDRGDSLLMMKNTVCS